MNESNQGWKGGRHKARRLAVQALYQWQLTRQAPAEIERDFLADDSVKDIDMDYFRHLVREIPEHIPQLDRHIAPHVDRGIGEIDPVERAILRLGAFEL